MITISAAASVGAAQLDGASWGGQPHGCGTSADPGCERAGPLCPLGLQAPARRVPMRWRLKRGW